MSRFSDLAVAQCRRAPNAKDIAYGVEEARGPVDIEDRLEGDAGGERLVRRTVITIGASQLPSVVRSALPLDVTVTDDDGVETAHVVRDVQLVEDGELKELILAEDT